MILSRFGSLMDIDKLIPRPAAAHPTRCFGSLMDIDKLILSSIGLCVAPGFGSLMDIDKLIRENFIVGVQVVLVL